MGGYSLSELVERTTGRVLAPGSPGYDDARSVYNGMIDKHPDVIVLCANTADVVEAVRFAQENDRLLAIQSGGHSVAGFGTIDGNVLAVLTSMADVQVDPGARRARAGAGVTWGRFDYETQRFGLATTGGIVHDTGIAGLTLGGGLGWLMGLAGLTCDNFTAAEIVTASGSVLSVGDTDHTDLMWALRGGGGNFGIVTRFEYELHEVGPVVAGSVRFPLSAARQALEAYDEFALECPDGLTVSPAFLENPAFGRHLSLDFCSLEGETRTTAALRSLTSLPGLRDFTISTQAYCDWQRAMSDPYRRGLRSYWKSISLPRLTAEVIDAIVNGFSEAPSARTLLTIDHVHGAAGRVLPAATAYGARLPFVILINTNWEDPAFDSANINWTRVLFASLADGADQAETAAYVNYLDRDDDGRVYEAAYRDLAPRLQEIKAIYDPENFFRVNHNIAPATAIQPSTA